MTREIPEEDWKTFRQLHAMALERFCERVLAELALIAADTRKSAHERYLAVSKRLDRRDREIETAFNDLRRSTAFRQLACIQAHKLWTEDEMARLSPATREIVQFLLSR